MPAVRRMRETEEQRILAFRRLADQRLDATYRLANAILGDTDCDGLYDVCQLCPDGTHPVDTNGDGCEDVCDCCKAIECPTGLPPIDTDGDGCPDSCCEPILCPLGTKPPNITTTCRALASSSGVNSRPDSSRAPIASKYPGVTYR